jgi:phosphatidylethanolamine-binding protein (PEBP) family uncharacterized protein
MTSISFKTVSSLLVGLFLISSCGGVNEEVTQLYANPAVPPTTFSVSSPAVANGGNLPMAFRVNGQNLPLDIFGVPAGTQGIAILIDTAAGGGYSHWLVVDLPPSTTSISANQDSTGFPAGTRRGYSSHATPILGYDAPTLARTYRVRAYALNQRPMTITLNNTTHWTVPTFEAAFGPSIIATAAYSFIIVAGAPG